MANYNSLRLKAKINAARGSIIVVYDPINELGAALKAYWDAEDHGSARMTDDGAGLISSWKDRIGGLDVVAAGSARPTYSTAYCGGREALLFNGTSTFMRVASTTGLPTGADASQIWVMYEVVGAAATTYMCAYGGTAAGTARRVGRSSSERWFVSDGTTTNSANGTAGATNVTPHMSMGRWNGTVQSGRTHGAENPPETTITTINTSTTRLTMGASNANTAANFFSGAISAILITDDSLTTDQRQKLESWGYREVGALAVLPSDHPYKEGPDSAATFTGCGTTSFIVSNPAMQPLLLDFRTSFLDQIETRRSTSTWVYNDAGSKVLVPAHTAAWCDHDPVTNEPLGLAAFSTATIYNADRTLASPAVFDFTSTGLLPAASAWFDTNATLAVYVLGSGQVRLQFSQSVHVLRADGTDETDWGLPAITTTDINIDCVDENAGGWYSGVHYFKMPRTPATTTVTMSKVGGATVVHAEAARGVASPPTPTGIIQRIGPVMYSSLAASGLPKNMSAFTFCMLYKYSHVTQGSQILTIDDNDSSKLIVPTNPQPVNRIAINGLSNPRFDVPKSGFMGVSYCTEDEPGDEDGESGGIDPEDVVIERLKWRCFFGTGNWETGEVSVACNGGAVRKAVFPTDRFAQNLRMIRWMGSINGGLCGDGWLGGAYLEPVSYFDESDSVIQAMCHPDTSLFGSFDPN